ncbi:hypothetical protein Pcinc_008189 [Petrolisthes cinctipes]|uniref:Secreted protein n=1 Tax=Petrolisthes cinctipes TaxID=88211 RepID=A0AAE1G9G1_PETCI|nr:hypothetical protein Pcinc_008189 [Petrolisthes cinctipes]
MSWSGFLQSLPLASRVSAATLVDTAKTRLKLPWINEERATRVARVAINPAWRSPWPPRHPSPHRVGTKPGKSKYSTRGPSFPVLIEGNRSPTGLRDCFWRLTTDNAIPY